MSETSSCLIDLRLPALRLCRPFHARLMLWLALVPAVAQAQLNITRQPERLVAVPSGQTATFSVDVTASPAPTFQWRRSGLPIAGATGASYSIPAARQFDSDFYDVVITSGGTTALSQSSRLLVTLPSYPGAVTVDPARSLRLEGPESVSSTLPVLAHAVLPDGRFYLAGDFSTVDEQSRPHLLRFHANGTIDPTFTPPAFDARPQGLAVRPDGRLVVTGLFKTVGGVPCGGIVGLNPDGSRDTAFAVGTGFANGVYNPPYIAPNGSIYVTGGGFGSYQGSAALYYIARLTSTGALDPTFTGPSYTVNGNSSINPNGFVFGPAGEIYVYGNFDTVNGAPRHRLARLLASGQVDPTFNPGTGPNNFVYAVTVLSTGQLVIGGDFTAYNGTPVGRIARLTLNGSLDSTFATGSGFSQQVGFLAELPGNAVFVGSVGNSYNGTPVGTGVRLEANGTRDTGFNYNLGRPDGIGLLPGNRLLVSGGVLPNFRPGVRVLEANGTLVAGVQPSLRFPARVSLLAPLPGGRVLVAGSFTHVNGTPRPYVMRLNADLSLDASFPNGAGPNAPVTTGVVQPDGRIVLFTGNGMLRLNADGSTDGTFSTQALGGYWYSIPPVCLSDGRLLVATTSSIWFGGGAVTNGLVILESNGVRTLSHPLLPGPNAGARLTGVQKLAGGQLLVAGSFTSWNGIPRAGLVRLNADGSVDASFVPDGAVTVSPYFPAFASKGGSLQRDGRILLATDVPVSGTLLRLTPDGARDGTFVSDLPRLFTGVRLLLQPDDRPIVVGQSADFFSGTPPAYFVRLTPNGSLDASFSVRGSSIWHDFMLADNGELLSNDAAGYLHRYMALPAPTIAAQPTAQAVVSGTTIQLQVTAAGEGPFTYQWFKDGAPLVGSTGATLTLASAQPAAAGVYTVTISNAGGSVTSQPALVSVTARSTAGSVFGPLPGNAGAFAIHVRADGTGAFIAFRSATRTAYVARQFTVGADRRFKFTALAYGAPAEATVEVEGGFAPDGSLSATLAGLALTAAPATTSGGTTALAGFYTCGELNGSGETLVIVGANGEAYAVAAAADWREASALTVDANGGCNGSTPEGARISGVVNAAGIAALSIVRGTAPPVNFSGGDASRRTDGEKLVNLSTRSVVTAGGSFTGGFVVTGDQPKSVLVRAIGPTLAAFGVEGALPAARLEIFRDRTLIAEGGAWGAAAQAAAIAATAGRVGAFALPAASRDAALLLSLAPGGYSARVTGEGSAAGVALVEVYDATEGAIPRQQRLVNLSTLAATGAGGNTLAAGFYVAGTVPKRLLIRGAGPALAQFGVGDPLSRPLLTVYAGARLLAQNAGWITSAHPAALALAATQVGAFAFPAGSADAALILHLAPGSYSAEVSGFGGTAGTALVEVYELP